MGIWQVILGLRAILMGMGFGFRAEGLPIILRLRAIIMGIREVQVDVGPKAGNPEPHEKPRPEAQKAQVPNFITSIGTI